MKKLLMAAALAVAAVGLRAASAVLPVGELPENLIRIGTERTDLILNVGPDARLRQAYLGAKLLNASDLLQFAKATEVYVVRDVNLMPGVLPRINEYSGDYLMKVGLPLFSGAHLTSTVVELTAKD